MYVFWSYRVPEGSKGGVEEAIDEEAGGEEAGGEEDGGEEAAEEDALRPKTDRHVFGGKRPCVGVGAWVVDAEGTRGVIVARNGAWQTPT